MSAVLRIALGYFSMFPLQKWLNWSGAIILVAGMAIVGAGMVWHSQDHTAHDSAAAASFFAFAAVILICFAPLFAGGAVLRFASTPITLHLRPNGRRQMLLGATLAVTLVATLLMLPALLYQIIHMWAGTPARMFSLPTPVVFLIVWSGTALVWAGVFATCWSLLLFLAFMIGAVPAFSSILTISPAFTPGQRVAVLSAVAALAWLILANWYMNAPSVRRPISITGKPTSQALDFSEFLRGKWFTRTATENNSLPVALHQHLIGTNSLRYHLAVGAGVTLLMLTPRLFLITGKQPHLLVFQLPIFAAISAAIAPAIVRRARLLWLKAGLDRAALFRETERRSLLIAGAMLGFATAIAVLESITARTDLAANIVLFALTQVAMAACFVYAGLGVTRQWDVVSVLIFIGLGGLFLTALTFQPKDTLPVRTSLLALTALTALILPLRWHARRRWLVLDWRVAGAPILKGGMRQN